MLFKLETDRLILAVLDEMYAKESLDFFERNQTFLQSWIPKRAANHYTIEKQAVRLYLQSVDFKEKSGVRLHLFKKTNPTKIIGNIGLSNIIRGVFWSCHLGYQIDYNERNQGFISEALTEVIRYGFEDLGLHRIEANVMPRNAPSIRVLEKLNFEKEGLSKNYLKINGVWEDHFHFVLLNKALE